MPTQAFAPKSPATAAPPSTVSPVTVPKISRATFTLSVSGVATPFGLATFYGSNDGVNYRPVVTLTVSPGASQATESVGLSGNYTQFDWALNSIAPGATASASVSY